MSPILSRKCNFRVVFLSAPYGPCTAFQSESFSLRIVLSFRCANLSPPWLFLLPDILQAEEQARWEKAWAKAQVKAFMMCQGSGKGIYDVRSVLVCAVLYIPLLRFPSTHWCFFAILGFFWIHFTVDQLLPGLLLACLIDPRMFLATFQPRAGKYILLIRCCFG